MLKANHDTGKQNSGVATLDDALKIAWKTENGIYMRISTLNNVVKMVSIYLSICGLMGLV